MELPDLSRIDSGPIAPKGKPSKLRLCTVPVYASCGYDGKAICDDKKDTRKLDMEILYNNFELDDKFVLVSCKVPVPSFKAIDPLVAEAEHKKNLKNKEKRVKEGKTGAGMFGNCVTFRYVPDEMHRISVKIFTNYRLHITGCKNFALIEELINDVILPKIRASSQKLRVHKLDGSVEEREISCYPTPDIEFIPGSIKPAMYNTQFNAGFAIDRNELQDVVAEVNQEKPVFLPKGFSVRVLEKRNYRGLPVILENYSQTVSLNIMIFTDGSHVINGHVGDIKVIKIGYTFINNLFEEYYGRLLLRTKV
jgi:hypothetical protein